VGTTGYALGALVSSTGDTSKNGDDGALPDTSTTNSYAWYDGPVLSGVAYKKDVSSSTVWTTAYTLSAGGATAHASISDGRSREVDFILDTAGQALRRNEADGNTGKNDPHQIWYRFAGREMGMVTNDATLDTDYAGSVVDRSATPQYDAFHNGANYGLHSASFGEKVMPY
jgi:hypothetical protein